MLMKRGSRCSWFALAGGQRDGKDQGLSSVYSPCQDICKSILGSYRGFFPKVKAFFEGVSLYLNKLHSEIFSSPNQTKMRFHFVLPAVA